MPKRPVQDARLESVTPVPLELKWGKREERLCRKLNEGKGHIVAPGMTICKQSLDAGQVCSDGKTHVKNALIGDGTLSIGTVRPPAARKNVRQHGRQGKLPA